MSDFYERVAADLDVFESVPDGVLAGVVRNDGSCGWLYVCGEGPEWSGDERADRETAARVCAVCPVAAECLEWELRTSGYATAGVWGLLAEDDRRAVFLRWSDRRDRSCGGGR